MEPQERGITKIFFEELLSPLERFLARLSEISLTLRLIDTHLSLF